MTIKYNRQGDPANAGAPLTAIQGPSIPHPYQGAMTFQSLEGLRRAVSDFERIARDQGVHPDEVLFNAELRLTIKSERLTDGSVVLNASVDAP